MGAKRASFLFLPLGAVGVSILFATACIPLPPLFPPSPGGAFTWVVVLPETTYMRGMGVLADGSCIVGGQLRDRATFGPGEPNETTLIPASRYTYAPITDVFIAKYNLDGTLDSAGIAATGQISSNAVSVFPDGSCLLAGDVYSSVTFDANQATEIMLKATDTFNVFLAKFREDGRVAWARLVTDGIGACVDRLVAGPDGSAIVAGLLYETTTFGPDGPNPITLVPEGEDNVFIVNYNPDGSLGWATAAYGQTTHYALSVNAGPDGSCLVIGSCRGALLFGFEKPNEPVLSASPHANSLYAAHFDPSGRLIWARVLGESEGIGETRLDVAADGSYFVTADYGGYIDFPQTESGQPVHLTWGGGSAFIAKFREDGAVSWARQVTTNLFPTIRQVKALPDGSCVVLGILAQTALFDSSTPDAFSLNGHSWSGLDMFIARYSANGQPAWVKRVGGPDYSSVLAYDLGSAPADGSLLVLGSFLGTVIFGYGEPNETQFETPFTEFPFIAKFPLEH